MKLDVKGDKLFLKNDYAGCMWIFYSFLLIPFVAGIYLLWQEPSDVVPLYFLLPFTFGFLITTPIMLKEAIKMRIVTLEMDRTLGNISISKSALFSKSHETREISEINTIQVECSDGDGEFFNVSMHFKDGYKLPILHGNHRDSIFSQIQEINDFLQIRFATIPIQEIRV